MPSTCALPPRYSTGVSSDPAVQAALAGLVDALAESPEYREYAHLDEAVNTDGEVYALLQEIHIRRASYSLSESGELEAKLEALPVMSAYRAAETALRALFAQVDELIGRAAGVEFCAHVRAQGHG